ncbi:hypothetical protein BDN70DRAFT_808312 [Pholiota conissans]|uniref:SprT-like domain-containing protein n=1 Tax=Pholiota conissans TaxID=109636 RepID=A0A9P5Z017_9AGAR|nr:hypothetical protein BDN70DRAFT_808312 [Pholiota conissans]
MARTKVPLKAPRANTKRARELADLQRRQDYAQKLFNELNNVVFKGALPPDTKLQWSKRLLSTAGKAKYHRSREGVETIEIELADKILDCDERIRNTLSHEMCHLATWVIDHNVREQHGKLFQNWAAQVMKKRPDIHVSIKHNYDITYPFEWECQKCAKVYGRFSNSINVDECACGACKDGKLKPLFTSKRKVDTPKQSRMAAAKPKGTFQCIHHVFLTLKVIIDSPSTRPTSTVSELDSNSQDIEFIVDMLTQTIASTSLT